jgi:WD40 repeat protein/V8-like Glu-specific endopeptidase
MSGRQAAVARATAAVFVGGRRAGSAVLVGPRYLVTAAHVLQRQDPRTLATVAAEQVELEFPGEGPGAQPGRTAAASVDLGPASRGADVAMLDLGEDRPGWLPAPVPVWPAARPPTTVQVFGYPLAEGPLNGVWRQFAVAGPATAGTVQLDWVGDAGTFPGHSGGPVIDAAGHALAGILVEGAERGRFDRFVPVTLIARIWPRLPRPWLMTGADPGEARSHFTRRARGQRSAARGGDLFRGRHAALDRIRGWLTAVEPPGQPLVLTGQPGAGKSAVLARAALSVEAGHGGPGLAFHARAATIGGFLTALADLTGIDTPASADELVASLADLPGQPSIPVVLDALDEAASDDDRRQIAEVLAELAVLPWLRVAVATRTMAVGSPFAPGGLLRALGVTARDDPSLIDLDSDTYFDLEGLRQFAGALLAQDGMDHPGPPGAAWTQYRARHGVRDRLAIVIAERAGRNFLVAAMAAVPLSTARTMTDPAVKGFDPTSIPSGVGEALSKYLDRLPDQRRERDRGLLTALAYARGAGLDDLAWLAFAAALGYDASVADLDALRHSPAADYLLQTTATERGARRVTRLFHQALADELLAPRHQPSDESALFEMLLSQAEHTGWQSHYLGEHMAEHAAAADRLDQLLEDPLHLLAVDPARLVPHLDAARSVTARATAAVYRQSVHLLARLDLPMRVSQLELTAHHLGCQGLAARVMSAAPDRPWQTRWSHGRRAIGHQVITGRTSGVNAVAAGVLPDGTPVIISSGEDRTVRVWRLADGTPVGEPLTGHDAAVNAVAAAALPDGTPVIISGGEDRTVRVWRLPDGTPVGEPLRGRAAVNAVAAAALPDGTPVIISGDQNGTVRVWRLADGTPVGEPLDGGFRPVNAVAAGALPDGTPVIISGGGTDGLEAGTVRVWQLADGTPVGEPLRGRAAVNAVAAAALPDGTPVIISGDENGEVRVWQLADGTPVGEPLRGHGGPVWAVAAGVLPDGTPVIISGGGARFGGDGTVRMWRLADGTPVGEPLTGHDRVNAVAAGALPDGTLVIISGGGELGGVVGTVRVWRTADGTPVGEPLRGHGGPVWAVAAGALPDGTPVIISGGGSEVRVWRLADGTPVGEPLTGHGAPVKAVAAGALPDGTSVIISGGGARFGGDGTVRMWRTADGTPVGEPLTGHGAAAVAAGVLPDGTPVIISGGEDGMVRVWRTADGTPVGEPLRGHDAAVNAVAAGTLPDGTPVIISGGGEVDGEDGTVRVWRLADGTPVGEPLRGHGGPVWAVAAGVLPDGTPVIISGGKDRTVRVWRLADGTPVGEPLRGHDAPVNAVAAGALPDGTPVIISGGGYRGRGTGGAVRVWRTADGALIVPPLNLPESVAAVAVHGNVIITAAGADIAVHQPVLPRPMR